MAKSFPAPSPRKASKASKASAKPSKASKASAPRKPKPAAWIGNGLGKIDIRKANAAFATYLETAARKGVTEREEGSAFAGLTLTLAGLLGQDEG